MATATIKVQSLNWENPDLVSEFKSFKRFSELVLTTDQYTEFSKEQQVNYVLIWMGPNAVEIFDSWTDTDLSAANKKDPKKVLEKFLKYFEPKSNLDWPDSNYVN